MAGAFRLNVEADGLAELVFDLPGEKVNKFSGPVMQELDQAVDGLSTRSGIRALTLTSAKEGIFIAGADIAEIRDITDPGKGAELARRGQHVFLKIERLPFPTVAVIDGACMGGGLEFALSCAFRVTSDGPKTQLALPEVSLGIVPGFGGTQRLPRLLGLVNALPLILSGKSVDGLKAFKLKLSDACYPKAFLKEKVRAFVLSLLTPQGRAAALARRRRPSMENVLESPLGRPLVYSRAKKDLLEKTRGFYPAPLMALAVVKSTFKGNPAKGYEIEAKALGELIATPTSKNLVTLFYTSESLKKDPGVKGPVRPREIRSAGVLGAGVMGGGIAWAFSSIDLPVRMKDIAWEAVAKGFEAAGKIYGQLIKIRKLDDRQKNLKMHRISGSVDYSGFQKLDVVVEAVVENLDVKKKVFAELEAHISPDAIVASNTSSLLVNDMAQAFKHPERFIGMHFFNPVNRMPLVEVVPGDKTSEEVTAALVALVKKLKKTPIVVRDCAGFLVNRILLPYMNEAAKMMEEGVSFERIDRVILDFGMPMGPFELTDEVGIDVGYKVAKNLHQAYGERMAVAPILKEIADVKKLLGKKAGKGFYLHQGPSKSPNPDIPSGGSSRATDADIVDRCMLIMVNEAARCLSEKIVERPDYLDMAMIMGTGFPPFRGGLLRYADGRGLSGTVERLQALAQTTGDRFAPAPLLVDMAKNGTRFYS